MSKKLILQIFTSCSLLFVLSPSVSSAAANEEAKLRVPVIAESVETEILAAFSQQEQKRMEVFRAYAQELKRQVDNAVLDYLPYLESIREFYLVCLTQVRIKKAAASESGDQEKLSALSAFEHLLLQQIKENWDKSLALAQFRHESGTMCLSDFLLLQMEYQKYCIAESVEE